MSCPHCASEAEKREALKSLLAVASKQFSAARARQRRVKVIAATLQWSSLLLAGAYFGLILSRIC